MQAVVCNSWHDSGDPQVFDAGLLNKWPNREVALSLHVDSDALKGIREGGGDAACEERSNH